MTNACKVMEKNEIKLDKIKAIIRTTYQNFEIPNTSIDDDFVFAMQTLHYLCILIISFREKRQNNSFHQR